MEEVGGSEHEKAARTVADLLHEHRSAVLAQTIRLTQGDVAWAEDVVQETFVRAWQNWQKMTAEQGSVRGWLLRVAHNLVMDEYRTARRRRGEVSLQVDNDVAVPEVTDNVLLAQMLAEALERLPEAHRRALELVYLRDKTTMQAAEELHVPAGTVKSRVFYGLRMLRLMGVFATPDPAGSDAFNGRRCA